MAEAPTVLFYYSGSADAAPGKGAGETITDVQAPLYKPLTVHRDWRKKLSNFYIAPFVIDNLTWNSVEHYYQASKFARGFPEFYRSFSAGVSKLSSDPLVAKAAGGRTGKFRGTAIRAANITIDPGYFEGRSSDEMFRAMLAKFTQNPDLGAILLLTRDAILTHGTRGTPTTHQHELMRVRTELVAAADHAD